VTADAPAARPVGSGTILQYLPRAIRVPNDPLRAIAVGWLTAFPVSIAFAILGSFLFPDLARPQFPMSGAMAIFLLVIFSPVLETLIMGVVLLVLVRLVGPVAAILASSAGWGIAHSLAAPAWGLVIWWPFLVFSTLFVTWRARSLWLAFGIPACVHALQNLPPAILVAKGLAG
jgi:hypothetical protein